MNKTAIKNFAIWARNKLIADIVYQAGLLGVTDKGVAQPLPQSTNEVQFFDIGTKDYITVRGKAIRQRNAFVAAIKAKQEDADYVSAFRFVVEKVAYTWFNRLIAIRFMEVNDYLPGRMRILSSENPDKAEPDMVTRPFDTDLSFSAQEQDEIMRMKDENKLDELFRMLFIQQCQKLHEVLPGLFDPQGIDRADSYLELLLTISFADKDGVLWHLVHDISEDDFNMEKEGQVEIIGWMYQYYNTEPKDQVFANLKKNIKINKDSIPAATQLFTPDWIVRYMVENSLGRLWVEGHPNEELKKNWKYYLEEAEQEPQVQAQLAEIRKEYAALLPEEIKVIDPCMGSGHILVYLFDVLMQIYESQGWTQREAAQSIVKNNLYGLDIDDRAAQLAYFAVMMKARQYDRRFLERGIAPHVYGIQESNDINRDHIRLFGNGMSILEKNNAITQLNEMLDALRDAKEYGSILNVPELEWGVLQRYTAEIDTSIQISLENIGAEETLSIVRGLVETAHVMEQKYFVAVTNPPYLGLRSLGTKTLEYMQMYYPDSKNDLFATFIERCLKMVYPNGQIGMVTAESWLSLSSFEKLRIELLTNNTISSMVHLGAGAFDAGFGTVAFTIEKVFTSNYKGVYYKLNDSDDGEQKRIIVESRDNSHCYYARQNDYQFVPGMAVSYWVSPALFDTFIRYPSMNKIAEPRQGLTTCDNDRFMRYWHEVSFELIGLGFNSTEETIASQKKWYPYNKGGEPRKWYGNNEYVVNWHQDGYEIKKYVASKYVSYSRTVKNINYYFRKGLTWSAIAKKYAVRAYKNGFIFADKGQACFVEDKYYYYVCGLLNSKVTDAILAIISPTLDFNCGYIKKIPVSIVEEYIPVTTEIVEKNIELSQKEWDSFEMSWEFKVHPIIRWSRRLRDATAIGETLYYYYGYHPEAHSPIEFCYLLWQGECNERFKILKLNEEKLNRIFIDIYGLQDELNPEVEDKNVTIRKADLGRDIRSLISYAAGCMLGRYSLDEDGLVYAGGGWDENKYKTYRPVPDNCIPITDEPYFEDDIVGRFVSFIRTVYGEEALEENLEFIAKALGNKGNSSRDVIRNYFLNDFIKDHIKIYQKRPIYWMFDSGKQNGFKALVYMHRWNADTVGNVRVEYLHRIQRIYEKEIERMQDTIDNSRDNREVNQASKRREKLVKQLKEARDYDAKIAHIALSRVEIDLDDGVKVNYEKVQRGPDGKSLGILAKI